MMTAEQCRAEAQRFAKLAEAASSYAAMHEWEVLAAEWSRLAEMAQWQDAIQGLLDRKP